MKHAPKFLITNDVLKAGIYQLNSTLKNCCDNYFIILCTSNKLCYYT